MESSVPTQKLFRLALLTSPVIGLLAIGTVSIVPYFFLKNISLAQIVLFTLAITTFIFVIWSVNIGLTLRLSKSRRRPVAKRMRYVLGYVVVLLPIFLIRLVLSRFVDEQNYINQVAPGKSIYFIYLMRFCILFSINTIILILQDLVLIRENKAIVELENSALRLKNMEALNQQLKQQIHPHFLFNSLNTLKALINRDPEKAGDYLVKLSDYLRTSISFGKANTVSLREELKLSTDYLDMQKMRFGEALNFQIDLPDEKLDNVYLPVLSLQLLLENAIKHNSLTSERPLQVRIFCSGNMITVTNNLQAKQTTESSLGFGLANLNERYRILSGQETSISAAGGSFSVSIPILSPTSPG
jgi:two-component system LytT family sensor kinase